MRWAYLLGVIALTAIVSAQLPPACPAGRPIDDIIAEIHKQQSKRNNRNPSLVPEITCIGSWCRDHSRTPPTIPDSNGQSGTLQEDHPPIGTRPADSCDAAMERVLDAAHNVDVGDFYFENRNYNAAMIRYRDAAKQKSDDVAIHVRLGRAYDKLKRPEQAREEYEAAQKLPGPQKWLDEAKAALARLSSAQP